MKVRVCKEKLIDRNLRQFRESKNKSEILD